VNEVYEGVVDKWLPQAMPSLSRVRPAGAVREGWRVYLEERMEREGVRCNQWV